MRSRLHHHKPRDTGSSLLVTRLAAVELGVPTTDRYIRKVCTPVACDVASRASLYDLDQLTERFVQRVA